MLTLRRFKTTAVFVALVVLLISAVCVYARTVVDDDDDNNRLDREVIVDELQRSGNYTYSTHEYSITNNRTTPITLIEQEFKHRVMQTYPDEPGKSDAERTAKANDDITDTVRIPAGETKSRYYRHRVNISELGTGTYYINAYTRINLDGIREDPTPKAEESSKTFEIMR